MAILWRKFAAGIMNLGNILGRNPYRQGVSIQRFVVGIRIGCRGQHLMGNGITPKGEQSASFGGEIDCRVIIIVVIVIQHNLEFSSVLFSDIIGVQIQDARDVTKEANTTVLSSQYHRMLAAFKTLFLNHTFLVSRCTTSNLLLPCQTDGQRSTSILG